MDMVKIILEMLMDKTVQVKYFRLKWDQKLPRLNIAFLTAVFHSLSSQETPNSKLVVQINPLWLEQFQLPLLESNLWMLNCTIVFHLSL
jgi:hypothetical protein